MKKILTALASLGLALSAAITFAPVAHAAGEPRDIKIVASSRPCVSVKATNNIIYCVPAGKTLSQMKPGQKAKALYAPTGRTLWWYYGQKTSFADGPRWVLPYTYEYALFNTL